MIPTTLCLGHPTAASSASNFEDGRGGTDRRCCSAKTCCSKQGTAKRSQSQSRVACVNGEEHRSVNTTMAFETDTDSLNSRSAPSGAARISGRNAPISVDSDGSNKRRLRPEHRWLTAATRAGCGKGFRNFGEGRKRRKCFVRRGESAAGACCARPLTRRRGILMLIPAALDSECMVCSKALTQMLPFGNTPATIPTAYGPLRKVESSRSAIPE